MLKRALRNSVGCAIGLLVMAAHGYAADYDLIFAGGKVIDGTGAPWFRADVGVKGDRIAAVGNLSGATADRRIDAGKLAR